jgi:hypothetical protein
MSRVKTIIASSSTIPLTAELIARAMEWRNLAAKLEQRAEVWREEADRWNRHRDTRGATAGHRVEWASEQTRQLAAWLRLASDHLEMLGEGKLH